MTIRELLEALGLEVPEGLLPDFVIFINGQPAFAEVKIDAKAKVVYLKG